MTIDLTLILTYIAKVLLALLLGALIGWERETQDKPAGLRDVTIVTLGACLFAIIALEVNKLAAILNSPNYDIGRILAYTIVSMGFLGSGVILQTKNKLEGITTAGILWAQVAVGILCGLGLYPLAVFAALCIYFVLKLKYIRIKFEGKIKDEANN